MMQIKEAGAEDIWIIQLLANQIWPQTYNELLTTDQIAYMMEMMYSDASLGEQMNQLHHHFLIACHDDEYLGYLSYELDYTNKSQTKIHKIYVLPSAQNSGVGRFFINEISKIALSNENDMLILNVNRNNAKALAFYTAIGFKQAGSEDIDIGDGFLMEDYIMSKKLLT